MVRELDLSIGQVCRGMSIGETAVLLWLEHYDAELSGQRGIGKLLITEQQRIRELVGENRQLRQDNDLLKTTLAFFARELK